MRRSANAIPTAQKSPLGASEELSFTTLAVRGFSSLFTLLFCGSLEAALDDSEDVGSCVTGTRSCVGLTLPVPSEELVSLVALFNSVVGSAERSETFVCSPCSAVLGEAFSLVVASPWFASVERVYNSAHPLRSILLQQT